MSTETFGELLKAEREESGLSVAAVAETLGVDAGVLRALERNDFGALPDEAVMKGCLHGYADCLDVDAELMIADYDRERDRYVEASKSATTYRGAAATGLVGHTEARGPTLGSRLLVVLPLALIAVLAGWWVLSRGDGASPPEPVKAATLEVPVAAPERTEPAEAVEPEAPAAEVPVVAQPPVPEPVAMEPAPAATTRTNSGPPVLTVSEHGVGTGVESRRLVGRTDRFPEGSRAWFWTRVQGGGAGTSIEHVWLREGVEVSRRSLRVGGSNWRTHSVLTLKPGSAGSWTVEARDVAGRVLARSEFVCVP